MSQSFYNFDEEIASVPDEQWEKMPTIRSLHTSNLVYERGPYRVYVSRMSPEDYGYEDWRPAHTSTNQRALRSYNAEKIVIEKDVPGKGFVEIKRTQARRSR